MARTISGFCGRVWPKKWLNHVLATILIPIGAIFLTFKPKYDLITKGKFYLKKHTVKFTKHVHKLYYYVSKTNNKKFQLINNSNNTQTCRTKHEA